jgi:ABC-type sugar transport system permease subunit
MINRRMFYLLTAPSIAVMLLLMVVPLLWAVWLGFNYVTFNNLRAPVFVGFDNYTEVLTDARFWQALRFTLLLITVVGVAELVIGFAVALFLDQVAPRARGIFLAIFLTSYISVPVISGLMFKQLFLPTGLGSWAYLQLTGEPFRLTELSVKTLVVVYAIWRDTPFVIIIIFAGLQTLVQETLEAAAIDGASRWQQIRFIALPHLRPLLILMAMIIIMDKYRIFDAVFVLSDMNPVYKADTLMIYNYRVAMQLQNLGKGSAISMITVAGIFLVLIPFLRYVYRSQLAKE